MSGISRFSVSLLKEPSKYVKPYRISFIQVCNSDRLTRKQNGKERFWDGILTHDSVSILIYHCEKKCLIFVKQFRPVVYFSILRETGRYRSIDVTDEGLNIDGISADRGETLELCAGLMDGNECIPTKTAVTEVLEECGYQISEASLRFVDSFRSGLGLSGNKMTLFYTEVTESQRVPGAGGGLVEEDEFIEIVEWPVESLDSLFDANANRPPTSTTLLYALCWFKSNVLPNLS
ncbi:Uridine diphosphate glucose pyrophosphatase [Fasciola gigantica]|uniref:Uridine diphosphate glucose pyrophosphatase NUDT14 n=1 Tax=Fasciola gigantica TaxID=46835 RepID=A0A504YJ86_FASGI|nr:Uridine diphosphate glucose pyrophosphatase [Fasciola gigantica]